MTRQEYLRRIRIWPLLLSFVLLLPAAAQADTPLPTLLANTRVEYRFDYAGDNTPITAALDVPGGAAVELALYTPEQVELRRKSQDPNPIGRGTPGHDHDLFWSGRFNAPGVYHIVIANRSPGPITYHLVVSGEAVTGVAALIPETPAAAAELTGQNGPKTLTVSLPRGSGLAVLRLTVPGDPLGCTHANQVPPTLFTSIKLCPGEIYPPLHLVGSNLALYGDEAHSAIVNSAGRQFAVVMEGNGNLVEGVTLQASADPADLGAWLCLYDECVFPTHPRPTTIQGGLRYGGGVLLRGSNSTVHAVTVHGGTIGVAIQNGRSNNVLDNQLSDLNGWGSFNLGALNSYFVGNTFNRENHPCVTPEGTRFEHGCETAGWVCLGCQGNLVARNHCESSANCFYMSGERGLASNSNTLIANYCAGATDNCFELTFSRANTLRENIATADPTTGAACRYPFWIGGSTVYFGGNTWACSVGDLDAFDQSSHSTSVLTSIISLDPFFFSPPLPTGAAAPTPPLAVVTPAPAATLMPTPPETPLATSTPDTGPTNPPGRDPDDLP